VNHTSRKRITYQAVHRDNQVIKGDRVEEQRWIVIILVSNFAIILTEPVDDVPQFLQANAEIAP
jgi:hypothetical protein